MLGCPLGTEDGCPVGCLLGCCEGWPVGVEVGCLDGWDDGWVLGRDDEGAELLGRFVGCELGSSVGSCVGCSVGLLPHSPVWRDSIVGVFAARTRGSPFGP